MKRLLVSVLLVAIASSCSTTSTSYVESQAGFSVTKGRILRIENLHSEHIEPLADGVVIAPSREGCRVALQFRDGRRQLLALPPGSILVCAHATDYVLRMENGETADTAPKADQPTSDTPPRGPSGG